MLGGAAWQGLGFYLFALFIPALELRKFCRRCGHSNGSQPPRNGENATFLTLGASLALLYGIFPLMNGLNSLLPAGATIAALMSQAQPPAPSSLWHSRFSSALCASALFSCGLFLCLRRWTCPLPAALAGPAEAQPLSPPSGSPRPLKLFTQGMALASTLLGLYLAAQHLTGLDYKEVTGHLASAKKLSTTGTYRTLGFYGHPLSLAGACLAIFAFFLTLLAISPRESLTTQQPPSLCRGSRALWAYIAALNFLFILLSGGRTAIVLAFLLILLYPFCMPFSGRGKLLRLSAALTAAVAGLAFLWWSGISQRYQELGDLFSLSEQNLEHNLGRPTFWRVYWAMFLDKPWLGHGSAWINSSVRNLYYQQLGLGSFAFQYNAHNLYLEILANVGIVGASALVLGVTLLLRTLKNLCLKGSNSTLFQAFLVALIGNLAHGLTQNTLFDSNVLYIYLYFIWFIVWVSLTYELRDQKV